MYSFKMGRNNCLQCFAHHSNDSNLCWTLQNTAPTNLYDYSVEDKKLGPVEMGWLHMKNIFPKSI